MVGSKFKILMLADSSSFHTERLFAELRRQGCHVLLASLERGAMHCFHLRKRGAKRARYVLAVPQVRRLITRFRPDVVYAHYVSGYGMLAGLAVRRRAVPIVTEAWGSDVLVVPHKSLVHRRKAIFALRQANCVVGDSEYLISAAEDLSPLRHAEVIPWGLEQTSLPSVDRERRFGKPLRIIVPRPHAEIYNNEFILHALRDMVASGKITLTFPSFGPDSDRFRRLAEDLIGDGIRLYDKLSRGAFLELMARHDIYLSAARSDSSPVSLIEAMGLGLIPVAADIRGVSEWLDESSGFLFEQNNEDDLGRIMTEILAGDDRLGQMRQDNQERVKRDGIYERNVTRRLDLMKRSAGERRL